MTTPALSDLSTAQRERLAYIDFRLWFLGDTRRADLCTRFGVAAAGATRDLTAYRRLAPENIVFDARGKVYKPAADFRPLFEHSPDRVLSALSQGFGDGLAGAVGPLLPSEIPAPLNRPRLDVLAFFTRAIRQGGVLSISYHSMTSGRTEREIAPFALIDNGLRWHARAFDRKTESFRDFVLTRVESAMEAGIADPQRETATRDIQWMRVVELELVPHPGRGHLDVIAMDFGMTDGRLRISARAATAGYVLRRWSIDCSPNHILDGPEYRLWLRDPLSLYGVESAALAPGYVPPGPAG